ncbi:MAG: primosomal protein N' [Bacteroidota bacterium]|nr:primosomal protein N' [Bacteroidota bacterium]
MSENFAVFVNVIIPLHISQLYTYRVPKEWEAEIAVGKRVAVQFGSKKVYSALVQSIHHQPPLKYEAKYIYSVLDDAPIIEPIHLKFWDWISRYYLCGLGDVMNSALPAGLKLESETRLVAHPLYEPGSVVLDDREYLIWEAIEIRHELSLQEVSEIVQLKNVFPLLKSMVLKGVLLIKEELEERYKEKVLTCVRLGSIYLQEEVMEALFKKLEKQEKQLNILLAFLHLQPMHQHIDKALLIKTANGTAAPLLGLIKKGIFETYTIAVDRIKIEATPKEDFILNPDQEEALQKIKTGFETQEILLLQGVTGSGKTHVYVKLIEEVLAQDKQVLFLLPEIALTSQIVNRVRKYFGALCISYHSKYGDNEKVEVWQQVKTGKYKIIIGARSALFLPFQNLGLVIVDEEHDSSYKQHDPAPRYHARDAAMMLARLWNCKTILGSATPAFETIYQAQQGKYAYVIMDKRFGEVAMPLIETCNVAEEKRVKTMVQEDFTSTLFVAIKEALEKGEQVILFQNRRGYAPLLTCNVCSWIPKCKNCDISLTYHKFIDSLKCHYCGFTQKLPKTCHACGSPQLTLKGVGTEKIEDELKTLFPSARVARLDLDAVKAKYGHEQIIKSFEARQFDILVGTQMLSKGLDFEHVSLVGVINADLLLAFPDFRAHERAYQLLLQVSGRAGRKHQQGRVIIQSSTPNHFVLQAVLLHQYEALLERELDERQKFAYPPYFRLIKIVLKHKDYKTVEQAANQLKNLLLRQNQIILLGPESPHVGRIRNQYLKEILIKINRKNPELELLKQHIRKSMEHLNEDKIYRSVYVYADVDPV